MPQQGHRDPFADIIAWTRGGIDIHKSNKQDAFDLTKLFKQRNITAQTIDNESERTRAFKHFAAAASNELLMNLKRVLHISARLWRPHNDNHSVYWAYEGRSSDLESYSTLIEQSLTGCVLDSQGVFRGSNPKIMLAEDKRLVLAAWRSWRLLIYILTGPPYPLLHQRR